MTGPYRCSFCGARSWLHPCDQEAPSDYCHESDHGEPDGADADDEIPTVGISRSPVGTPRSKRLNVKR